MPPELNRELLTKVVDHALSAPNWDQRYYVHGNQTCGTSYCIAGFTAVEFGGWRPVDEDYNGSIVDVTKDGEVVSIDFVAENMLGLTVTESDKLFYGGNTADDIRQITKNILNGVYRVYRP